MCSLLLGATRHSCAQRSSSPQRRQCALKTAVLDMHSMSTNLPTAFSPDPVIERYKSGFRSWMWFFTVREASCLVPKRKQTIHH